MLQYTNADVVILKLSYLACIWSSNQQEHGELTIYTEQCTLFVRIHVYRRIQLILGQERTEGKGGGGGKKEKHLGEGGGGRMKSHNLLNVSTLCQPEEEEDHPWGGQVSLTFS